MCAKITDETRQRLLIALKRQSRNPGGRIWRTLYERLQASRRNRVTVNLGDLQSHHTKGRIMVVPGKVLGDGIIEDKLQVAAFTFSENARQKIEAQGGKCLTLEELMEVNPTGKDLMLIASVFLTVASSMPWLTYVVDRKWGDNGMKMVNCSRRRTRLRTLSPVGSTWSSRNIRAEISSL